MVDYKDSQTKVTIVCKIIGHGPFEQAPNSHIQGAGCAKCSGVYKHNTDEFIQKAKEKHGDIYDYSMVDYTGCKDYVTIICAKDGHGPFEQTPDSHINNIAGCPSCVWKTEGKLYGTLKSKYPTIQRQFKADWCKNKTHLPFDFCIEANKTIFELDGGQHFTQVSNWTSPEEQFQNDIYKQNCANENGYSVIRLLQQDVLYDRYDWCKKIDDAIEEIKNSDEPKNIYLCENNEYYRYK